MNIASIDDDVSVVILMLLHGNFLCKTQLGVYESLWKNGDATATCHGSAGGLRTAKELEFYQEQEAATLNAWTWSWILYSCRCSKQGQ